MLSTSVKQNILYQKSLQLFKQKRDAGILPGMTKLMLEDDGCCFACGLNNPDGLQIKWVVEGSSMTGQFIPSQKYQGWKGVVHGGILATLLDEAMTRLVCAIYGTAVTAEMTVRYVAPAQIGELLYARGEIVEESPKLIQLKASLRALEPEGKLIAHATSKAMILNL